ncbi:MAG: histidine--tRNA ligase, partial [Nanoarchaeota archaeon]|nr:histidine--tRNA ligase [Nanoarchaeota archaeon]
FYPEEKRTINYIFSTWKKIAQNYGYEEIDMPILESVNIYNKSGDEIPTQIYSFKDKNNRVLALRPETTPSVARMVKSMPELKKPLKWFSISQCYRYEQLQKARGREFFQFNLDYLGTDSQQADAEVIVTLIKILTSFNLKKSDFYIRISNRKLINDLFKELKINNVKELARIIDKKCKLSDKDFKEALKDLNLNDKQIKELLNLFKIEDLEKIKTSSPSLEELKTLFSILKKYKVLDYCKLDLSIMRGFDYYTSTVFEAFDKAGDLRAIAGGGRYDNLAGLPGVGYGFGDMVLATLLKEKNLLPDLNSSTQILLIPINTLDKALQVAEQLRKENLNITVDLQNRSISKNLDYANKQKIPFVIFLGENELKEKKLKLKDMKTGKEKILDTKDIIKLID